MECRCYLLRQCRAVDDKAHFGVQLCRTRIEIERTNEHAHTGGDDSSDVGVPRPIGEPRPFSQAYRQAVRSSLSLLLHH